MLNPNNDRLDYGQIIAPPADYNLDFAIGTTYSLDLDALVGACIALGLAEETDSDLMKNPICLLEALRATGDKIALFCEGGQIHLTQLSEFYKISVSDGKQTVSRVIMIPTENMPTDREKAVVSSVVNDKSCFYRYIAFLLGDNMVISALESNDSADEVTGTTKANKAIQLPALYEKMLRTAATVPERFKEIEYLIKSVSADGVIPEGFEELYNTFRKVVKM